MSHILHTNTVQKTASLVDKGNFTYAKLAEARNTYINLLKLASRASREIRARLNDQYILPMFLQFSVPINRLLRNALWLFYSLISVSF